MTFARIMVVEDERIVALNIRQQLERLGYEVPAVVASGEQALARIGQVRPDVVLMDIRIEGALDGIQTAALIPDEYQIPVVYLTAYSEEATLERAKETCLFGYLLKPFSERELHATIQMAIEKKRDETRRQQQDAQLHQAQKLEAVGQLAGGVAHDFNNLLAIIQGNLELIQERAVPSELAEMIGDALKAAKHGAELTRQLLAYSRNDNLNPEILDVVPLITELTRLLRRLISETVEIRTRLPDAALWKLRADESQLMNALLNLAVNARDAMPEGGVLTIGGRNLELSGDEDCFIARVKPGSYAAVSISDTGVGMSKEVARRAVEPFFTTKPVGQGTGLGLSQAAGFVTQSNGNMRILTAPLRGTTVELCFPAVDPGEVLVQREPPSQSTLTGKGECILVVEDDALVRKLVKKLLNALGYRVVEAENGVEAQRALQANADISLLITDLVLPKGMDGTAVAAEARALRPLLKVLFMSGYAADAEKPLGHELLQKPFTKAALGQKVQAALRGS